MRRFGLALALVLATATAAFGQSYPTRPIRMVVPFPAGGGVDTMARISATSCPNGWDSPYWSSIAPVPAAPSAPTPSPKPRRTANGAADRQRAGDQRCALQNAAVRSAQGVRPVTQSPPASSSWSAPRKCRQRPSRR